MEVLPLEKPLLELHIKINELKAEYELSQVINTASKSIPPSHTKELNQSIKTLENQFNSLSKEIFSTLTPYEVISLSRHPSRPYTLDIIKNVFTDFVETHGDRSFSDDAAIVTGIGRFHGQSVVIMGHQKGRGTKENIKRNFGMPKPEGYRKAIKAMHLAERFGLPIISFIDTPGAYPGVDAEERGQSEAVARSILEMINLTVPVISVIFGEGGSGGALAIGTANTLLMMQYSTYSVISPEGCASILWKDGSQAPRAAEILSITSKTALDLKIADEIIPEPLGGAHWNPQEVYKNLGFYLEKHLKRFEGMSPDKIKNDRFVKFQNISFYEEKEMGHQKGEPWQDVMKWVYESQRLP